MKSQKTVLMPMQYMPRKIISATERRTKEEIRRQEREWRDDQDNNHMFRDRDGTDYKK